MEKVSKAMQLKRLRIRKALKGRFWFSNSLDIFRAQRKYGSIRIVWIDFDAGHRRVGIMPS